ncbi:hypothetical protein AB1Y20_006187 [Prymnesium parvum]|uniref:Uncharacterized protein n=1 Tax=Prymnesium parvum TaxID=97485 RepID=A0AB34J4F2_PRYPA
MEGRASPPTSWRRTSSIYRQAISTSERGLRLTSSSVASSPHSLRREQKNDQWVSEKGVPGFKSPSDERREALHIGKIAKALGIPISKDCPKSADAYVAPECPCATLKGIPPEHWYYSPRSEEYKSGEDKYTRQPPADVFKFGYYHKLGKCRRMREEAHKLAKADPAKIGLLTPLPRGSEDCITL